MAQAGPLRFRLAMDGFDQRPAHRHRKIPARRLQRLVVVVVGEHVVVDIDAADKGHLAVHHADLAVGARHAAPEPGVEDAVLDTGRRHFGLQAVSGLVPGAKPVGNHAYGHAALRSSFERGHDAFAGFVLGEDIGLEIDFDLCGLDRLDQCRKIIGTAVEEFDFVIGYKINVTHVSGNQFQVCHNGRMVRQLGP